MTEQPLSETHPTLFAQISKAWSVEHIDLWSTHSEDCTSKKGSKENPIIIANEYPSIAMWFERMSESCGCEHEVIRAHRLWPYVVDISQHNQIVDANVSLGTQLMNKIDEVERLQTVCFEKQEELEKLQHQYYALQKVLAETKDDDICAEHWYNNGFSDGIKAGERRAMERVRVAFMHKANDKLLELGCVDIDEQGIVDECNKLMKEFGLGEVQR